MKAIKILATIGLVTAAAGQFVCGIHPYCDGSFSPAMAMTGFAVIPTLGFVSKIWGLSPESSN